MDPSGKDLNTAESFREEVLAEIARLEASLKHITKASKGYAIGYIIVMVLLVIAIPLIFLRPNVLLMWLIVAFFLYMFNYLIFFLPTSRHAGQKKAKEDPKAPKKSIKGPLRYLFKKKRRFAFEAGTTMFLVGMVPLALSFFIIFGIGLVFTVYYSYFQDIFPQSGALWVIIQILVIMVYFILIILVTPQSQGFSRIARSFKKRIGVARSRSRSAFAVILAITGIIVSVISIIGIGAILVPGTTFGKLVDFFQANGDENLVLLLSTLVLVFIIMRHFQAVGSRRMAANLVRNKIIELKSESLEPLDGIILRAKASPDPVFNVADFEKVKESYYNNAIYQLFESNFFGYSPVYLVVPRMDYVLDEKVMVYVGNPQK